MAFQAGTYGLKFCLDFLKLSLKIEKLISFMGIYVFSIGAQEQKLCPISSKHGRRGSKKNLQKFEFFF